MAYEIKIDRKQQKNLDSLDKATARRIHAFLTVLSIDPYPPGALKVANSPYFRIRIGDYRVVYLVHHNVLVVQIVRIGHRSAVYRGL